MESFFRVFILLSVASLIAANGVDPNTFECTSKSPSSQPVYSDTDPPVSLTHIFCGEINKNNPRRASGFHSRHLVNKNTKPANYRPCAKATGKITCDSTNPCDCENCTFSAGGIQVLNKNDKYVEKKLSTFFPDSWKPQFIVDLAIKIFKACMPNGVMVNGHKAACLKNYKITDHDCSVNVFIIKIFTDGENITTIFPTMDNDLNKYKCDYTCTLPDNVEHSEL